MRPETQKLLNKASRSIRAAGRILQEGDVDFASSRAYCAMFYVAEALLNERGLRFKKHGGVHAAFTEQFVKTKQMDQTPYRFLPKHF